ncbi:synaptotagmin-2 [Phycodurus eques]|uniref:synaptotagmin-2 n=1 Tax=Phycodurus eques TaxID=693459 RepID=UPI002ACE801A|nr:synaptotagmin-2 [Phycodurus eques]XP_061533637.1 synaptotagmin-2 [Phycodurus eques]
MMVLSSGYFSGRFLSSAAVLRFPFSAAIKYSILSLSVALLLVALGILAWQAFRCFRRPAAILPLPEAVNGDLLYTDDVSEIKEQYKGIPTIKVEDVDADILESTQEAGEDKKFDGWLHYSVYYDEQQHHLVVTVLEVEGLQQGRQTSSLQLFVQLKLLWIGPETEGPYIDEGGEGTPLALSTVLQEWRTRIVKGTCNPLFGDQFSCILHDEKELEHIDLRMEVRDFDKFSRHAALGEVRTPLGQLNISYPLELKGKLNTPRKDLVGNVLLSLKFLPTSQRIEVGVLKVRTVHTELHLDAALYVRISVQCNRCKLKYQKTSAVLRGTMTVFNEVLVFSLPELPLQECKILVNVFETHSSRKSSKHLIGQLTVNKDKNYENEHLGLILRSVRQPIARWHALLI